MSIVTPLSSVLVFAGYMLICSILTQGELNGKEWNSLERRVDVGTVIWCARRASHTYVSAIDRVCFADSTA